MHGHRQVESLTMDREVMHLRDSLMPKYAELVYYGFWFAPEREALQALVDEGQRFVTGTVRLKLYKGNVITCGRKSQVLALRHEGGVDGGREELVQPGRRDRVHPAERPAAARARPRAARAEDLTRRPGAQNRAFATMPTAVIGPESLSPSSVRSAFLIVTWALLYRLSSLISLPSVPSPFASLSETLRMSAIEARMSSAAFGS